LWLSSRNCNSRIAHQRSSQVMDGCDSVGPFISVSTMNGMTDVRHDEKSEDDGGGAISPHFQTSIPQTWSIIDLFCYFPGFDCRPSGIGDGFHHRHEGPTGHLLRYEYCRCTELHATCQTLLVQFVEVGSPFLQQMIVIKLRCKCTRIRAIFSKCQTKWHLTRF
jgi:hypothetical protein